ncbi:MAG: MarR family transcriptional regulator [Clostridiales bacterium]|nr:MarR family transcriptional regulator [Clostridiales bacterium]
MNDLYDVLKIENQVCFPLYAAAKEVVKQYQPYLDPLDLTYTQYITMMVLWERKEVTMKDLGSILYLDSGTLTPLLKKMEAKGFVQRKRSKADERTLNVVLTEAGEALKERAVSIPMQIGKCVNLTQEEGIQLYGLLHKVLAGMRK